MGSWEWKQTKHKLANAGYLRHDLAKLLRFYGTSFFI